MTWKRSESGISFFEVIIIMMMIGIVMPLVYRFVKIIIQSQTSMEAQGSLNSKSSGAVNRISATLGECKRIFDRTPPNPTIVSQLHFGVPAYPPISATALPQIEVNRPFTPSSSTFVAASVGNSLFFARYDLPIEVQASGAATDTVKIDRYMFVYYYVAQDPGSQIVGKQKRSLWEWRSLAYLDRNQILEIPEPRRSTAVTNLIGTPGLIPFAVDISSQDITDGFFLLDPGDSNMTTKAPVLPPNTIHPAMVENGPMVRIHMVNVGGGYRYGVSPNNSASHERHRVPRFAAAAPPDFPSGFEVVIVGPSNARQAYVRLVMAAQGAFPGPIFQEHVSFTTVNDTW